VDVMPYTKEFNKLLQSYKRKHTDQARVNSLAFEEAFRKGIRTFTHKEPLFKRQNHTQLGKI
jgi:hypothetical protein